jgi:hypothetical protein
MRWWLRLVRAVCAMNAHSWIAFAAICDSGVLLAVHMTISNRRTNELALFLVVVSVLIECDY